MSRRNHAGRRAQRGMSLITSLLFMVAALILGVSMLSINVMQERMIGNTKDRELAMQAAEAGLRDAELDISLNIRPATVFRDDCTAGLCTPPSQRTGVGFPSPLPAYDRAATPSFVWEAGDKTRTYGEITLAAAYPGVARPPLYVIERLGALAAPAGGSVKLGAASAQGFAYRITARGFGSRADTVVMLQSIYYMR